MTLIAKRRRRRLWLHYDARCSRGPKRVVENLLGGLQALQDKVEVVDRPGQADLVGALQAPGSLCNKLPSKSLIGPNVFVLPKEEPEVCGRFKNFIVPSNWVKDLYEKFPEEMKDKNIWVWPVGIDTSAWEPEPKDKPDLDCFLYVKNRDYNEQGCVELLLKKRKMKYEVLAYGSYEEEKLKELCDRSKFAVLLTNTESQGIAYMSILSTNTPCYVFNQDIWQYENKNHITAPATSVPYFDQRCGAITKDRPYCGQISEEDFDDFIDKAKSGNIYSPRDYILENHTLEKSATRYLELLERAHAQ